MSLKLNERNYIDLINQDINYLLKQPRTLERGHILMVLEMELIRVGNSKISILVEEEE